MYEEITTYYINAQNGPMTIDRRMYHGINFFWSVTLYSKWTIKLKNVRNNSVRHAVVRHVSIVKTRHDKLDTL